MEFLKITFLSVLLNLLIYKIHPYLLRINFPIDRPDNIRKFHKTATLLSGGLIFFINLIFLFFFLNNLPFHLNFFDSILNIMSMEKFLTCVTLIFILGLLDDKYNIKPLLKFTVLIVIIFYFISGSNYITLNEIRLSFLSQKFILEQLSIPFTILCYLLFINAFNMFDGINLQNAIYTLFVFVFFLSQNIFNNFLLLFLIPLFLFIFLNYRNKSFLGDSGCYLLSFIISLICIQSYNRGQILYADSIFIIMMLPGVDMFRLFITRILNKNNPFYPDRNHFHHILKNKIGEHKSILFISILNFFVFVLLLLQINNIIIAVFFFIAYITSIYYCKKLS